MRWCCETFMPETEQFLRLGTVKVISARDAFSTNCPTHPGHWKRLVFDCIRQKLLIKNSHCFWNIVIIGASDAESGAASYFTEKMINKSCCKFVRLGPGKSSCLVKQHECLAHRLNELAQPTTKKLSNHLSLPLTREGSICNSVSKSA